MENTCDLCYPKELANIFPNEEIQIKAMMTAVQKGHPKCLRDSIKCRVDVNFVENDTSGLFKASSEYFSECVSLLIEAAADINFRDVDSSVTCLMVAAGSGSYECVVELLTAGAGVNVPGECGLTSLMMAARSRNPDSVKALLTAGADVNSETDEDYNFITALTMAVYQGHEKYAELLIAAGARLEGNPVGGYTPY